MNKPPALIELKQVVKDYPGKLSLLGRMQGHVRPVLRALDHVSLRLGPKEVLGLVGESGSGKTTIAKCIVGLEKADGGEILIEGAPLDGMSPQELRQTRRQIQMVYQDPYSSLNPRMSVQTTVTEPALVHGLIQPSEAKAYAEKLMDQVSLSRKVLSLRPSALSGGQRQRVAIARALSMQPKVILADEAVSALDVSIQAQVINLFAELIEELGVSIIFISHQLSVIAQLSDRVAILYLGRVVETGSNLDIFGNCAHPYTRALLDAHPEVHHNRDSSKQLRGEMPSPYKIPAGCRFNSRCVYAQDICFNEAPPLVELNPGHFVECHILPEFGRT